MDENNYNQSPGTNQNSWEQQPQQQSQWGQPQQQPQWQQPQQNQWQQGMPPYQQPYQQKDSLSVGEWLVTLLILLIPCAGMIMLFIWAFGNEQEPRRNFARAFLIYSVILIALYFILIVCLMPL